MDPAGIASFLRARRERLQPEALGLVRTGRRRTPGLRRDEVAERAGISIEYYAQLEQARGRHPSRDVLAKVARALALSPDDRAMLFELAGIFPGYPARPSRVPVPGVLHLLADMKGAAVTVKDAKHDVIAWNSLAAALLGDFSALPLPRRNLARRFFLPLDGEPPHFTMTGEHNYARFLVATLRRAALRYPRDASIRRLVADLMASPTFAELWALNAPYIHRHLVKTMQHPVVGRIELDCVSLHVPESDQEVVIFTAKPKSASARKLRELAHSQRSGAVVVPAG